MNLLALKELMLRKTEDESLKTFIKTVDDNLFLDYVVESLQKMAHSPLKGSNPNEAVSHFQQTMNPDVHPMMIREALGHHASRYKAALAAGNQRLANEHAGRFFKILDFAHTAAPKSDGKLDVESIALQPWEMTHKNIAESYAERAARDPNYKADPVYKKASKSLEQRVRDTKNTAYKPAKNDWSFIRNAPSVEYKLHHDEVADHGHTGAYPMEQVKINGLHIPIGDVENLYDGNKLHPFDHHPILEYYNIEHPNIQYPATYADRVRRMNEYKQEKQQSYDLGPHPDRFAEHVAKLHESGALEGRGLEPGPPVHHSESQAEIDPDSFTSNKSTARRSKKIDLPPIDEDLTSTSAPQPAPAQPKAAPLETAKSVLSPHLHDLFKR